MRTQIRPTSINITSESSVVTTNVDPVADPTAPTNTLAVCRLPNDSVTTSNTTDFVDGGSKVCVESTSDTATLYTDTSPNFYLSDQNLIDYFGKPHQCATWTWDT
jgi:selenophosphate synthase